MESLFPYQLEFGSVKECRMWPLDGRGGVGPYTMGMSVARLLPAHTGQSWLKYCKKTKQNKKKHMNIAIQQNKNIHRKFSSLLETSPVFFNNKSLVSLSEKTNTPTFLLFKKPKHFHRKF